MSDNKIWFILFIAPADLFSILNFITNFTRPASWIPHKGQIIGSASISSSESTCNITAVEYEFDGIKYNDFDKRGATIIEKFDGGEVDIFINPKHKSHYITKSQTNISGNIAKLAVAIIVNVILAKILSEM